MKAWLGLLVCLALPVQANEVEALLAAFLGDRPLRSEGLEVTVAQGVEDGAFVPVDLQLRGAKAPLELLILRSGEDDPRIARVRLPASQALIVAARDGDGRRWLWRREVSVYASSCAQAPHGDPLAGLGEFRVWGERGDELELRALLRHPMETGRRPGPDGQMLARRLLREFRLTDDAGELLVLQPFEGMSANPLVRIVLPARDGALRLRWEEADGSFYRDVWPR